MEEAPKRFLPSKLTGTVGILTAAIFIISFYLFSYVWRGLRPFIVHQWRHGRTGRRTIGKTERIIGFDEDHDRVLIRRDGKQESAFLKEDDNQEAIE